MSSFPGWLRWCRRSLTGCILLVTFAMPCRAEESAGNIDPEGKYLEQLANNGIPSAYGEILSALQAKGAADFTSAANQYVKAGAAGGKALTGLAAVTSTRNALNDINQMFGRLFSGIDVTVKLGSGDNAAAAEASAVWFVTEMAGTESGKKLLSGYGITPPVVSALLVSYSVWRESEKALAAEEKGRKLESLFGSIEIMTRSRGRTLGVGDPFPPTKENIDKVWQRILTDPEFREGFTVYITEYLQKELPSAGFFDWTASYVGGDSTEDVTRSKLKEEEQQVKQYAVGLVNWLNRAAKVEEQRVLTYQQLKAIALRIQMNGSTVEQAMARFDSALVMLGVVAYYLNSSPQDIRIATEKDDFETLQSHLMTITNYTKNVIAWLPSKGPLAEVRAEYLAALKDRYKLAANGYASFRAKLKLRIDSPKLIAPDQTARQGTPATGQATPTEPPPPPIDPTGFYRQYLAALIKPFDWGGAGEPGQVKKPYEMLLSRGEFNTASLMEKAWAQQNFTLVMTGMNGVEALPAPPEESTFAGYEKKLRDEIAATREPGEILSLQNSLQSQWKSIGKLYRDGNCLVFPTWYECGDRPKPPADETLEEGRARRERGQAMMAQSRVMSDALEPSEIQIKQMSIAWAQAKEMAIGVISDQLVMAKASHSELSTWMQTTRAASEDTARQAGDALAGFRSAIQTISLPQLTGATEGETALAELDKWLADKRYVGIGTLANPGGDLLAGAEAVAIDRSARLRGEAQQLSSQADRFLTPAYSEAAAFARGVPLFADAVTLVTPAIDTIVIYAEPDFRTELSTLNSRSVRAQTLADKLRSAADSADGRLRQEIENREADGYWLHSVAANIRAFRETALRWGVLEVPTSGNPKLPPAKTAVTPNALLVDYPYIHYLTTSERNAVANELRGIWSGGKLAAFAVGPAPWFGEQIQPYLDQVAQAPSTPEANFCVGESASSYTVMPVTSGNLAKAKQLHAAMVPGQLSFEDGFTSLRRLVPMAVSYDSRDIGTFKDLYLGAWQNSPLGKEYLAFRAKLKEQNAIHLKLWPENQLKAQEQQARELQQKMGGWLSELRQRLSSGDQLIIRSGSVAATDRPGAETAIRDLTDFLNRLTGEPYRQVVDAIGVISSAIGPNEPAVKTAGEVTLQIGQMSGRIQNAIEKLKSLLQQGPQSDLTAFYEKFREAYESRNESALMALIGDDWESGDGTTLADLQGYLRNSFTVFDQVTYKISGLTVAWNGKAFGVSYDVTITGRNFKYNLKHEEKSTVSEEVSLDSQNRPRITRTLTGRFWYVQ